jgi:hypothetical protein
MDTFTLPDYVVSRPVQGYGGFRMQTLVQGSFDSRWQLKR